MTDSTATTPAEQAQPKRKHSPAHRAEFVLARSLEKAVSFMPEGAADSFGATVGRTLHGLGIRRETVDENLRIAFPDQTDEWREKIRIAAYEHLGREAAAMLRLSKLDSNAVVKRTVTHGWDELKEALSFGRGVLLVTGHYGNWEIAAATVASRGIPIAAIVRRQGNRLVDERLQELRRNLGVETIYQGQAPTRVPRILRANGVVGIVGDQDARRSGVFAPFFGRPASTHRGPALFALRLNAPVFSCIARRLPGDKVQYEVRGRHVDVQRTGNLDADVLALTTELSRRLEEEVRRAPEQYFWFHKRWKTRPLDED
ncbi:MAG TPA: lysophospholipid acyltransferase family protein [Gemmatimonadaceae bacterium]